MIRFLLKLLIFLAGLAAAAIWFGEMRHLRQAAPDQLPFWTGVVLDDARIPTGSAGIALPAGPGAELVWTDMRPGATGLTWKLDLSGDAIAVRAELLVPYWPGMATVRNGQGTLDLGGTLYRIEDIAARVPLLDGGSGQMTITLDQPLVLPTEVSTALGSLVEVDGRDVRIEIPAF